MMEKDWIFHADGYNCDLRAAGVLIRDGNILVQRDHGGSEYAPPRHYVTRA